MDRERSRASRLQIAIAAIVLAVPILYLATDLAVEPWWWRFSRRQLFWIAVWSGFGAMFLASYRLALPRALASVRTLVVAVAATLLVNALLGELLLRSVEDWRYSERIVDDHRHAPDPDVGHVFVRDYEGFAQTLEWRARWQINGERVRADHDYGAHRPGVLRILAVGDSFTLGDQVEVDQTWPGVLEAELGAVLGRDHVEVINAGHPAYGTVHEGRWLAKFGRRFEPDLVVLAMTPNDLAENLHPLMVTASDEGYLHWQVSTEGHKRRWQDHQRWYSLPGQIENSRLLERLRGTPWYRRLTEGEAYVHRHAFMEQPDEESKRRWALAFEALDGFFDTAREMGAHVAVVAIPFREQLGPLEPGLDGDVFGQRIAAFAQAHDVPALDVLPVFRAYPEPGELYWKRDSHCTGVGYHLIGAATARFLLANARELGLPTQGAEPGSALSGAPSPSPSGAPTRRAAPAPAGASGPSR